MPPQQAYLTASPRLKHLYDAFREPEPNASPARARVSRKAPALLMLFTRLQTGPGW